MPLPTYLMSNFPSVRPSLNLQFDSQPTPEDMTSHLASVGATFSRASIGTYTDANGLIAEASAGQARPNYSSAGVHEGLLIEESRTNLVKSSEDFSTTDWTKEGSVVITSGQSNTLRDDATATLIDLDSSDFIYANATVSASTNYNFSFFIKAGTASTHYYAFYDNSNSSFIVSETEYTYTDGEDYGNGWYRVNFNVTTPSGCTSIRVYPLRSTSGGSGNGTTLLFGAQLEEGSFPTSYIPTIPTFSSRASTATYFDSDGVLQTQAIQTSPTGVGRIDHKYIDGEWVEAGLLLEGASTNLVTDSEDFSGWTDTNVTVTANDATAPDGETTATKLTDDATDGQHRIVKSFTTSSSGDATYSIFLKKGTLGTVVLNMFSGGTIANADVNLVNGTIEKNSGISATIENVDNDWYRCSITGTLANTSTFLYVYMQKTNSISYIGSGDTVFVWGAQLEEQSQPTSYIATSGGTATRSADVYTTATKERSSDLCYIDGTAFTDFYNQEEGTVLLQHQILNDFVGRTDRLFQFDDGGENERIQLDLGTLTLGINFAVVNGGSIQFFTDQEFLRTSGINKIIGAYKANDFGATYNGATVYTGTSGTIPAVNILRLGRKSDNTQRSNMTVSKLIYFPRRLSNAELIKLTQ
jgi:hypothetical protein